MIDIKRIVKEPEAVIEGLKRKSEDFTPQIRKLIELDRERRDAITATEELKRERNEASRKIGQLKKEGKETDAIMNQVSGIGDTIKEKDALIAQMEEEMNTILLSLPNIPDPSVPDGKGEEENLVVRNWGEVRKFDFPVQDHVSLGEKDSSLDLERGAKVAQARFHYKRHELALLERALINFMLDLHTRQHGYVEYSVPFLVNRDAMTGTGQLPKFEEDLYRLEEDDLFLIPTAEVPLTNLFAGEILPLDSLPVKVTSHTPCFRREKFSHGKDVRGILRQHQFHKVELVKFVRPEDSCRELESLVSDAEAVLEALKIPYQVLLLCTGDMSFSSAKTYDIEAWIPSQGRYREVSSCTNFEDFQARRAGIRFKNESGKNEYVHTLNGSALAVGRLLIALVENYQEADGSVRIPEVLQPYMNGTKSILKGKE
ncbi:MAG TPA: serine--tRNA ligase [Candidatus Mcinerneyibacteriales bacterium]|nr:serine--tRNA ligase [Candidatus Mcinerneyibacteriales bacterium]HPE21100.1 serine--tRNA ligase [Candidatus Mcinerneyibacteriales bacterium]